MTTAIIFTVLLAIAAFFYSLYASLITQRNQALEALSGIDVQLQQRGETLPNLLAIAKKYMEHEKSLLEDITALRSKVLAPYDKTNNAEIQEHLQASTAMEGKVSQFMLNAEAYPDLKSQQPMILAMQSNNELEANLAASRRFYNSAVSSLNNKVQIFPGSLIAGWINITPMPFYEAPAASQSPGRRRRAAVVRNRRVQISTSGISLLTTGVQQVSRVPFGGLFSLLLRGPATGGMDCTLTAADGTPDPFVPYYATHIQPLTGEAERERLSTLSSVRGRMLGGIPLLIGVYFIVFHFMPQAFPDLQIHNLLIIAGIATIAAFHFFIRPLRNYQSNLKDRVFPLIFKFFGPDFIFNAQGGNLVEQWRAFNLLPDYDDAYQEDYLSGSHNGVPLELQEARLTVTIHSDDGDSTKQVFRGLLLRLQFNKPFEGKTLLLKDTIVTNLLHGKSQNGLQRVALEDPQFEALFQVFATSQVESRRLLTPAFMQRLLNLAAISGAKPQACFAANSLYITLESNRRPLRRPQPLPPRHLPGRNPRHTRRNAPDLPHGG